MHIGHGWDLNENTKLANLNLSKFNCFIFIFIMWDRLQEKISIAIKLLQQKRNFSGNRNLFTLWSYFCCNRDLKVLIYCISVNIVAITFKDLLQWQYCSADPHPLENIPQFSLYQCIHGDSSIK